MSRRSSLLFVLSFLVSIFSFSFAQYNLVDFESGGLGADFNWVVTENDDNPALAIITNPDQSGDNVSSTVAEFTAKQNGQSFALCFTDNIDEFKFDESNTTVKIMVWKPVISDVALKFEGASPAIELKVANTAINQWEELEFDFSGSKGNTYSRLVIIPDFAERDQDNVLYFDNIQLPEGNIVAPTEPTVAAPTPTQDPADVISLFSDAYTDVTVDTWRTDWSAATFEDVMVDGNATKKYSALDFVGIETVASTVDASSMTHFHIDIWSADFTFFGVKLVDFGADGAFGGDDDVEHQINFEAPAQGEWISYDIPLSDFAGLTTQSNIAQYILVGQPSGATTIYVDNIYFYKSEISPTEPTVAAPTPTQDAADVISLFSDAYTDVTVDTWRTDWSAATFEDVTVDGNATKKYSALDFVGIETVASTVDASNMTHFHIDVWSADFTFFGVKLVDFGADGAFGGDDDVEHQINFEAPAQGEWISYDIPLSDFTGLTTREHIAQYILVGQPTGATTVFVDNVYFYTMTTDIKEVAGKQPLKFDLQQNFPNPFNPETKIRFSIPEANHVSLKIYNMLGQEVVTLVDEFMNAGTFDVTLNAVNLSSGSYYYMISSGGSTSIKKMLLIK